MKDRTLRKIFWGVSTTILMPLTASAQPVEAYRVVVNSSDDGSFKPDDKLTLREAIALTNSTLSFSQLSEAEKQQVQVQEQSTIEFDLPPDHATIRLVSELPPLASADLLIDGTTNPGYKTPVVAITPAPETEIQRGLSINRDRVVVRGLSLYGFTAHPSEEMPADVFIAPMAGKPPTGVVIEDNWLGVPPDQSTPPVPSAFGVSVFNGNGVIIRRNRIANHDGSGIITLVNAQNLRVTENIIANNGRTGIPDAVRLQGTVAGTQIDNNFISGNGGSAVYLFKPEGAVTIRNNKLEANGQRLPSAAIYLIGSKHQVTNNRISQQSEAGVVVAACPTSQGNVIQANRFVAVKGLSIDLNTRNHGSEPFFRIGDGPNALHNSSNRRQNTGNAAINAPQFLSEEFIVLGGKVGIDGTADPGSAVTLYRTDAKADGYGALREPLLTVPVDETGKFSLSLDNLQPGDTISAIATDPRYGTSEPAENAVVRAPE